jgi:hypothetical protein
MQLTSSSHAERKWMGALDDYDLKGVRGEDVPLEQMEVDESWKNTPALDRSAPQEGFDGEVGEAASRRQVIDEQEGRDDSDGDTEEGEEGQLGGRKGPWDEDDDRIAPEWEPDDTSDEEDANRSDDEDNPGDTEMSDVELEENKEDEALQQNEELLKGLVKNHISTPLHGSQWQGTNRTQTYQSTLLQMPVVNPLPPLLPLPLPIQHPIVRDRDWKAAVSRRRGPRDRAGTSWSGAARDRARRFVSSLPTTTTTTLQYIPQQAQQ